MASESKVKFLKFEFILLYFGLEIDPLIGLPRVLVIVLSQLILEVMMVLVTVREVALT